MGTSLSLGRPKYRPYRSGFLSFFCWFLTCNQSPGPKASGVRELGGRTRFLGSRRRDLRGSRGWMRPLGGWVEGPKLGPAKVGEVVGGARVRASCRGRLSPGLATSPRRAAREWPLKVPAVTGLEGADVGLREGRQGVVVRSRRRGFPARGLRRLVFLRDSSAGSLCETAGVGIRALHCSRARTRAEDLRRLPSHPRVGPKDQCRRDKACGQETRERRLTSLKNKH